MPQIDGQTGFNQQTSGLWNRRLILQLLMSDGPHSRLRIARQTGIRKSTVTYIVRELLQTGRLGTAGCEEGAGAGRRHVLLKINPDYGWSAGISLQQNGRAQLVFVDAAQKITGMESVPVEPRSGDFAADLYEAVAPRLVGSERAGKFLGVGVGLPGIVDSEKNAVLFSRRFQLQDYPLGERLGERLGVPVKVDHNVHLAAYAERYLGQAKSFPDFLYFMINRSPDRKTRAFFSFGTALHLSNEVYRGAHFSAGELDIRIAPAIDISAEEAQKILAELEREEGTLGPLADHLAESLAESLAPVANLLDPGAIVIGSEQPIRHRFFLRKVETGVRERLIPVRNREIPVLTSGLGSEGVAIGAALLALINA